MFRTKFGMTVKAPEKGELAVSRESPPFLPKRRKGRASSTAHKLEQDRRANHAFDADACLVPR